MQRDNKALKLVSVYCYIVAAILAILVLFSILPIDQNLSSPFYFLQEILGLSYLSLLPIGLLQSVVGTVLFYLVVALLYFIAGKELLNHKSWARNLVVVLSLVSLLVMLFFVVMVTGLSGIDISVVKVIVGLIIQVLILYFMFTKWN